MKKISTIEELRESITELEVIQETDAFLLKEQFKTTYQSLKPVNLIKNVLHELTSAPDFKGDLLTASLSLAAGFVSKKVAFGTTHNPFKQILGTILQMGVTKIVSNNSEGIKLTVMSIINQFKDKNKSTS